MFNLSGAFFGGIFSANVVVGLLMLNLIISKGYEIPASKRESKVLLLVAIHVLVGCIIAPILYTFYGRQGEAYRLISFIGNTILFAENITLGPAVIALVIEHINEALTKTLRHIILFIVGLESGMLLCNCFVPILFSITEDNYLADGPIFETFAAAETLLLVYAMIIYFIEKREGNTLRYFPVLEFIAPIALGLALQNMMYDSSVLLTTTGISICGMVTSLQKENIYIDKLTGLLNRYYLEEIKRQISHSKESQITALMLDMNGFKAINDDYSHAEGDAALMTVARILTKATKRNGDVIRFAGDEFIVIIRQQEEEKIAEYTENITDMLADYNKKSGKPYQLSASVGGAVVDMKTVDVDDMVSTIDREMYAQKEEYYRSHDRRR